jgi:hypothetical protein
MLTNLLPGFRDLRTPLTVGYIWLLALWLLLEPVLPIEAEDTHDGPIHSLFELSSVVGSTVVLAGVSVIAYLLGTILFLRIRWNVLSSKVAISDVQWLQWLAITMNKIVVVLFHRDQVKQLKAELNNTVDDKLGDFSRLEHRLDNPRTLSKLLGGHLLTEPHDNPGDPRKQFYDYTAYELERVAIRLQAKDHDLWDTFDRYKAETEFRSAIVIPMWGVTISAIWRGQNYWWLLLFVASIALLASSGRRALLATATLVQAVSMKIVQPPIFDRWEEFVSEAKPDERTEEPINPNNS